MMAARGGRPLLLIDLAVPRDIDPACAELPGVTLLDIDGAAGAGRARTCACAGPRRARAEGDRRGGDPGVRGLARLARGAADAGRAARRAATRVVDAAAGRERGPLGGAVRARPRARRGARARGRQPAAARADRARARARRRAPPRAAAAAARAVRARGAPAAAERRRRPPRSAALRRALTPLRLGTRGSALALAQARAVAALLRRRRRARRDHHRRRRRPRARRQVALGRRARGRAAGGRDRPRGALGQGRAGRAGAGHRDRRRAARAADPLDVLVGERARRAARGRAGGHERAAPARAAARRAAGPRGRRAARQRRHAAAQARGGRGRRARARRRRARAARPPRRGAARCSTACSCPPPGQGVLALQARAGDAPSAPRRADHARDARGACDAERAVVRALGATCHTPVGVLARDGGARARRSSGLPDGSAWIARRGAPARRPSELARAACSPRAPPSCCARPRRCRVTVVYLVGAGPGRPRAADRARARADRARPT